MTNCTETARTPDEQQLVDVAAILATGILRLRERPARFSVMSRTNEANFELLRRFRTFLKALDLFSEIKRRRAEESSVGIKEGELRFLARKEPVNQLTQKAESERSRLFALNPWISKGLRRFGRRSASFSSEPVALDLLEATMEVGLAPREQPFRTL